MDPHVLAAQTNDLIRDNQTDAALLKASEFIQATVQQRVNAQVHVSFKPSREIGVACHRHIVLELAEGRVYLDVPTEMLWGHFSNNFHSFDLVGALIATHSVRAVSNGRAIIDLEDAANDGDYDRVSFSCSLPKSHLIVDTYYVASEGYAALQAEINAMWIPWIDREATVFWRGSTTGIQAAIPSVEDWIWAWLPRLHLCDVAERSRHAKQLDIGVVNLAQIHQESTSQAIRSSNFMRPAMPRMHFMNYRYVIDIDGNANAWNSFFGAMLMGSCILKVMSPHGWKQWYYDRLVAGVHFVPVKPDFSDFDTVVDWALSHPADCAEIARRARQFALSMNYADELDLSGAKLARLLSAGNHIGAVSSPGNAFKGDCLAA